MRYKRAENSLYIYADDIVPRHVTAGLLMDYDTMAGGDKFGNLFMTRLPADTSAEVAAAAPSLLCPTRFLKPTSSLMTASYDQWIRRLPLRPSGRHCTFAQHGAGQRCAVRAARRVRMARQGMRAVVGAGGGRPHGRQVQRGGGQPQQRRPQAAGRRPLPRGRHREGAVSRHPAAGRPGGPALWHPHRRHRCCVPSSSPSPPSPPLPSVPPPPRPACTHAPADSRAACIVRQLFLDSGTTTALAVSSCLHSCPSSPPPGSCHT